jgi:general secretion pathway protein K|tara:strand:+ start:209 stop:1177 length:969 start_codon:yes stop_codon:yes gene_type:complete
MLGVRQRGVALISVLLVVVIATVLSVSMIRHQNLTIHKARNVSNHSQAKQYAIGGEELARQILWQDTDSSPEVDHLQESWAEGDLVFEFENGEVSVQIEDLQGRFNINSLMMLGNAGRQAQVRFVQLLQHVGLDTMFMDRAIDWMDGDIATRPLGAEDYAYLGLERPYRTASQLIVDTTELRLLLDMDAESFDLLLPFISALPYPSAPLNVNTAPPEVLQTVSDRLSRDMSNDLIIERDNQDGYQSVTEFLQSSYVAGLGIAATGLGVQSKFFEIRIRARYFERNAYLTSIVERNDDGSVRVIYRNFARKVFPEFVKEEEQS